MKILIVTQYYYPERFSTHDVARELYNRGHQVTVITGKPNYGYNRILENYKHVYYEIIDGVKVHRIDLIPRKDSHFVVSLNYLSFYFNARRFIRRFKEEFDIVLSFSLSPIISISPAIIYAKKHQVPHLLYVMDLWPESTVVTGAIKMNSLLYKILFKWSKSLYSECDKLLISSPSFKDYFLNVLDLKKPFVYINQPTIVNSKPLTPITYQHKYNFVYAGNFGTLQLVDLLVRAFVHLKNKDIALHLMGMGPKLKLTLDLIKSLGLEDQVFYHGMLPLSEAERFFVNSDGLIVSLKDNPASYVAKTIPNKATQYLSYGKPIIAIIKGDAKELLTKSGGAIFANEDENDIATQIKNFINLDNDIRLKMGSSNKAYYDQYLSLDKIIDLFEQELIKTKKEFIS